MNASPGAKPTGNQRTRFKPGNKAASGHGRPPNRVKRALIEILDEMRHGPQGGASLTQAALDTIAKAMSDRDGFGNVTGPAIQACRTVLAYRYGMPKQTTEINVSGAALIQTVRNVYAHLVADDARTAIESAAPQRIGPAAPPSTVEKPARTRR